MSKVSIGIDLGSTQSEVAIIENGSPVVIPTSNGKLTFDSIVGFNADGERLVGAAAKRQQIVMPKSTINLIKRFIGRTMSESEDAIKHVNYDIVDHNGYAYVKINGREYSPQEISAMILSELKHMAEEYTGTTITDAVITVPAMFDANQRSATQEAGKIAGLNVMRIIAEPTAACIASKLSKSGNYMVVDFGGSTTDVSVVEYDADTQMVEVLASFGDTWLGGADIDNAITKYIVDEYRAETGIDLSKDKMAMQRIIDAAEKAKIELSSTSLTDVNLPYITADATGPKHLQMSLTRAKFEQLVKTPVIDKVINCAMESLKKADLSTVDGIILVGGSCRIPLVQDELKRVFNVELIHTANLDTAVAEGAAIQANILSGNLSSDDIVLVDVTPISLGIVVNGNQTAKIIKANTTIPTRASEIFTTAVDNQTAVTIQVVQGERLMAADNKQIAQFNLDGIAPARRGVPQIEVTFDIDANGLLNVTAVDKATNKEQHITVDSKNSLTEDEIERMKRDAEEHRAEDDKREAELKEMNSIESYRYSVENTLNDEQYKDKFTQDERTQLTSLIADVDAAVKEKDLEKAKSAKTALENAFMPIIQRVYGQQQNNEQK